MSVVSNVINKKRKKTESKPQSQLNKCLNEKRRREQENIYIEELAELISASASDMSSLSVKPDKCAILQETVNQIRRIRQNEPDQSDELQQSEVSSSKPTILPNDVYGPMLLEALDGFLFVVNIDGKIAFVSDNVTSFLKYTQDDLVDTSIYKIIHVGDRARFSSSLLPMMSLGNVSGLTPEPNTGVSKSRSFNCRFLIKSDFSEENMDDKQPCIAQYENMQVSAVFFPVTTENNENANNSTDAQNHLACVARRIPPNEKSPTSLGVEQFTTRLDVTGKIIAIDISGLSSPYSQHLHKDLVGCILQELCHPSDLPKLNQHLKETLRSGNNTSAMYRFRVGQDRYVHMQTKSKRFNYNQSSNEQEFIMSTHSIIRDSDNPSVLDSNSPMEHASPSCNPTTGALANNLNGSMGASGTSLSTAFTSLPSLSPGNQEFGFPEMFDMFPGGSNWVLDNSTASRDSNGLSVGNFTANSPQSASASGHSVSRSAGVQQPNSAFSPGMISGKSNSSNPSPSAPGRAPTPFSSSLSFSPAPAQSVVAKTVSPGTSVTKNDDFSGNSSEGQRLEISSGTHFSAQANQKLRDLLTKNVEGLNRSTSLGTSSDECGTLNHNIHITENSSAQITATVTDELISRSPAARNLILRELLNQEEDFVEPIENTSVTVNNIGSKLSSQISDPGISKSDSDAQKKMGSNDMLRRLLNNGDNNSNNSERSFRKSHDLLQQFLKGNSPDINEKASPDLELHNSHLSESSMRKELVIEASSSSSPGVSMLVESTAQKRKPEDVVSSNSVPKKPNIGPQHTHLAGQNPMLASMLAQTPRTPPSVPTSIANSIMSQLPQERLPKNLEKKLIHTPYTTASTPSTSAATRVFTTQPLNRNELAASIQQNIVTSDSRTQLPQLQSRTLPVGVRKDFIRAQGNYLNKALGCIENIQISQTVSSTAVSINVSQQSAQAANPLQQFSPVVPETLSSQKGLRDMLCENTSNDFESEEGNQQDSVLNEILEELFSLEQELRTSRVVQENNALLKFREGVVEQSAPAASIPPKQNENEKVAIRSIQLELMNFEGEKLSEEASHEVPQQSSLVSTDLPSSLSSQQSQLPTSGSNVLSSQFSSVPQPPSYTNSTVVGGRIRLPVTVAAGDVLTNSQQILELAAMQRIGLSQYSGLASTSTVVNATQIKRSLMERKTKLYLQQQQKRLLEQQQKQQLTMQTQQPVDIIGSSSSASFSDMNDLLNNTVAPNVSLLQRSSSVPEQQLSPRYSSSVSAQLPSPAGQPPTPSQLSPNQRVNPQSPFSPISQQPFSSATPPTPSYQSQPSPHPVPSYVQGGSSHSPAPLPSGVTTGSRSPHLQLSPQQGSGPPQWNQRSSQNQLPNNLLQQNPMLNAQLSQGSFTPSQIRLAAQQRQIPLRSLPSPGSVQNSRSSPFGGTQSDGTFPPLSPIAYQSQGPQQRLQRTVSGPGRVSSTRTTAQGGYVGSEPVLSPQPQPSPGFSQSVPSTPVSNYTSVSGHTNPVFSLSQDSSQFSFDPQNVQIFASSANERPRVANNTQVSSDFVRQELRAIVGARTQQGSSALNPVSLASGTITTAASVSDALSMQSLSNSALEDLGISVELLPGDVTADVAAELYSQSLLSIAASSESSNSRGCIPSPRVEETKPGQKKSLLQQLLSEPT